jgi:hypothetical protein
MEVAPIIYLLCALTAAGCSALLYKAYRTTHAPLLLWSALCFAGLTLSNLLVVIDNVLLPMSDFAAWRVGISVLSISVLLYGLIMESR